MYLAADNNHQFKLDSIRAVIKDEPEDRHFWGFLELNATSSDVYEATGDNALKNEYYQFLVGDQSGD